MNGELQKEGVCAWIYFCKIDQLLMLGFGFYSFNQMREMVGYFSFVLAWDWEGGTGCV